MSAGVLEAIVAGARRSAELRAAATPHAVVEQRAAARAARGDAFRRALTAPGIRVIAECKRRSPSKGVLRADYAPAAIAASYVAAGAAAISVLTEPSFFDGALSHLDDVRRAVDAPLLRKDFIVNEYQVAEAAALGADAVLLIVAALDAATIARLLSYAESVGLIALVEAHNASEAQLAIDCGATVVGVNSRDLRTLEVHTAIFDDIIDHIPDDVVAVAESGLRTGHDLARLHAAGYDAFLVGERFMTGADPGQELATLMADAEKAGGA